MKKAVLSFCIFLAACCGYAQSMNSRDSQFAKDAAQAGLLEIKLGELSISHAASDSVKVLGRQIILDHTKSNNLLKTFAVSRNLILPETLNQDAQARYDSLSLKSGADFDRAYMQLTVANHKHCIAMFKEENNKGLDNDLKAWASVTLPVLENHLITAQDLSVDINKK